MCVYIMWTVSSSCCNPQQECAMCFSCQSAFILRPKKDKKNCDYHLLNFTGQVSKNKCWTKYFEHASLKMTLRCIWCAYLLVLVVERDDFGVFVVFFCVLVTEWGKSSFLPLFPFGVPRLFTRDCISLSFFRRFLNHSCTCRIRIIIPLSLSLFLPCPVLAQWVVLFFPSLVGLLYESSLTLSDWRKPPPVLL